MNKKVKHVNFVIYLCILIISILCIYLSKKIWGKLGLSIIFIITSVLSLILTFKYIMLSTINVNANSITYITMFTSLYLLLEVTNKEEVKKIANINFLMTIFAAVLLYITSYYVQSLTDTISINMKNIYIDNARILLTYPVTTLVCNYLLIWMYKKIRKLYDVPFITTVTTYLFIGLIAEVLFYFLSYYGKLDIKTIIKLLLSINMIKLIITIIYSIFLTILTRKKVQK